MTDPPAAPGSSLNESTKMAVDRTRLAHERTLMAWVRTSTSLISFGFTIYKFFDYVKEKQTTPSDRLLGSRGFAMAMISLGVVALVLATLEHHRTMEHLRREYGVLVPRSLAMLLAFMVAALGVLGLLAVAFRQ